MVWIGRLVDWHGGGECAEWSDGEGAVTVVGADEVGSGGVVDSAEPFGGQGDGVTSSDCEHFTDGLLGG